MAKFKQYRISDMIKALQAQKKQRGNLLVEMSVDEEGNQYWPIGDYVTETEKKVEVSIPFGFDKDKVTIYPCEERQ